MHSRSLKNAKGIKAKKKKRRKKMPKAFRQKAKILKMSGITEKSKGLDA